MARIDQTLRRTSAREARPRSAAPAAEFDVILSFAASLTQSAAGMTATATGSLDADEKFEFTAITNPGGVPATMVLSLSAALVCSVDFPGDYLGHACRYVSKAGASYDTTFQSGTVTV